MIVYHRSRQRILQKQTRETTGELVRRLRRARREIARKIQRIQENQRLATNAGEREDLYREILAVYHKFAAHTDKMLRAAIQNGALAAHEAALEDFRSKGEPAVIAFDKSRVKRYWEMIHPDNESNLAAVFTQRMAQEDIRALRTAFVETFRQAQLEGWTSRDIHKNLQRSWDGIARNLESYRFIDAAGRQWANADYLSMLTRTTLQKVARESYADTLIQHGDDLAIIQTSGENCHICDAWGGLVISLTGRDKRYPSLQQAYDAGMFHPNCDCSLQGYVEAIDGPEAKRQAEEKNVRWEDTDEVQKYNDRIRIAAKRDAGMTAKEADVDLKRDKLRHRMQVALMGEHVDVVDQIPRPVLERIPQEQLPRFEFSKQGEHADAWNRFSERGGVIHVPRGATSETIRQQTAFSLAKTALDKVGDVRDSVGGVVRFGKEVVRHWEQKDKPAKDIEGRIASLDRAIEAVEKGTRKSLPHGQMAYVITEGDKRGIAVFADIESGKIKSWLPTSTNRNIRAWKKWPDIDA